MVVDAGSVAVVADLPLPSLVVEVGGGGAVELDSSISYESLFFHDSDALPSGSDHDDAIMYYSSGTSGLPKAAVHTHEGVLWNSIHQIADLGITRDDVYLVVPSLSWAAGFHDVMLALMMLGGRSVIMPTGGTSIDQVASTAAAQRATKTLLVPTLLKQLLDDSESQEVIRNSKLTYILTGAEPVPRPMIDALNDCLPACRIVQGYGLSEGPTIATILSSDEAARRAGSAGRPNSITEVAVQDPTGNISSSGEGEILLRSFATMKEYWRRPDETAAAFADGWLHTGDVAAVDEEGYVTITGRMKDMIISGGLNVYPSEIEAVIYELKEIAEVAVVGIPDDKWGEVPVAIIVGHGDVDTDTIREYCRTRLSGYKTPREFVLRHEPLPRNPSGKVLKRELRPWALENLGRPATPEPTKIQEDHK